MTISEIARRTGRDRKTIRSYLDGSRVVGERKRSAPDAFDAFEPYVRARLIEDPHLWAQTLMDELLQLGFELSYQSLTRKIRQKDLRPVCQACRTAVQRPNAVIAHPPGEETQFDWLELPDAPPGWGAKRAFLFVGSLAHSGKWRAVLAPSMDQPHLLEALSTVVTMLGGMSRVWRFDRMATVCHPATGELNAVFAGFAKHYGVQVAICPPRAGHRKGVVEKANLTAAQRWWRTLPDETTFEAAQESVAAFAAARDDRDRQGPQGKTTVAAMAVIEPLAPVPAPYPVLITESRTASRQALVSWRGNSYSVPPELAAATVTVTHRLGAGHLQIASANGTVVARHARATDGLGAILRDTGHVIALDTLAMAAANTARPHRRKERIPPGAQSRAAATVLRGADDPRPAATTISLAAYARAAAERTRLP